jgi:protein-tyrosine phosphatase
MFMTYPRRLALEGAVNFRDLGGYAAGPDRITRWRRLYRSDSLAALTDGDLDLLAGLELFGISDFRLQGEREANPDRLPGHHAMRLLTPGFIPAGTEDMLRDVAAGRAGAGDIRREVLRHYELFAREHLPDYRSTFRMLVEAEGRPVLLHCTSGKDRTGFGIALILLALGCDAADILDDYEMTNDYRRDIRFMFRDGVDTEALAMLTMARREYLETALAALAKEHGPPAAWLPLVGLDAADRKQIREWLTEPVS